MSYVQIHFIDVGNGSTAVLRCKGLNDLGLTYMRLAS